MKQLIPAILSLALSYYASAVRADQSISVEWSKSENYLEGEEQRQFYKPETATLYYSAAINEAWNIGGSLWSGDAEKDLGIARFRLFHEHSGASVFINYLKGNWGLNLALSRAESEVDVRSTSSSNFYQEETDSTDFSVSMDYIFSHERFDIVPSFGLGVQRYTFDSERTTALTGSFKIKDQRNTDQSSSYAFAGLGINTWFELSQNTFLLPAIQLSWSEAIDGDSTSSDSRLIKSSKNKRSFTSENSGSLADGSGNAGLSLALLVDAYQFRFSYSKTLALDVNTESIALEVGVSF